MTTYYDSKWKLMVVEEIKRWINDVLSVPSDHFNGLPPCPYAKQAWVNGNVKVNFGGRRQIDEATYDWPQDSDVVIVVITEPWDFDDIEEWCEESNKLLANEDFVLMPFVPGSKIDNGQPEEESTNWEPLLEDEYAMVFIQSLSELETASSHLMSKGYYKNCTEQFMKYVNNRAERYANARSQQEVHEKGFEEEGFEEAGHQEEGRQ